MMCSVVPCCKGLLHVVQCCYTWNRAVKFVQECSMLCCVLACCAVLLHVTNSYYMMCSVVRYYQELLHVAQCCCMLSRVIT